MHRDAPSGPPSDDAFRELVELSSDLLTRSTPAHVFTYVSPAVRTLLGYEPEELVGRSALELVHPDDVAAVDDAVEAEGRVKTRVRLRRSDGRWVWMEGTLRLVRGPDGELREIVASSRDVTERVETERALRESESRLRMALRAARMGTWEMDLETRIVLGSAETARLFGFPAAAAARSLDDYLSRVHPEDVGGVESALSGSLSRSVLAEHSIEFRVVDPAGVVRWLASRGELVRGDGGNSRLVGAVVDVTELQEAHDALRRARDAAEAANQAKSGFLATISHELRTPLNAIVGYAELLAGGLGGELTDQARHQVERIRLSAHHLQQLIEEVLAFSRLEAGREAVDLHGVHLGRLLREVSAIVEPLAEGRGLTFRASIGDDVPERLETDPRKLRQVLLNLLGNAVKFTERGGVRLEVDARGGAVVFAIHDTGIGVAEADRDSLFEPFWQADTSLTRSEGGTGLGLAITRRFVEMLGGQVRVRSAVGEGSTFTVVLPLDPRHPEEVEWEDPALDRREHEDRRSGGDRRSGDDRRAAEAEAVGD